MIRQKLTILGSLFVLVLYLIWSMPAMAQTQTTLLNGINFSFKSEVLKETRQLWIRLPQSYYSKNIEPPRYPVVYLLDAESNFTYFTGFVDKLSSGPYASIPEMIVVGIVNTDRTRDLTPSVSKSALPPGRVSVKGGQKTGGNEAFFKFLQQEVMPAIEANFPTEPYRVLVGHSFGGITALNALLNHNELFNAYIVHDPSIWWDDQIMLKQYQQAKAFDFKQRKLYLSQVDESEQGGQKDHYAAIKAFEKLLAQSKFKGLSFKYQQFENEDHGTIPLVGNNYGLRYIFDGYRINLKAIPKDPDLVARSYAQLSQSLGHDFKPSELYLDRVGQYLLGAGELALAQKYLQQNLQAHPKSPQAHQSMADYYRKVKDNAQAKVYREKAKALGYKAQSF
ncbi:MAG: hypothetical protein KA346_11245 [Neisseriaceae bacterium]|nr:hypothetical protein [Neisseriaceae bacterium]